MSAHGSRAVRTVFVFICRQAVLCWEMLLQALKMPPADQAFDRVAAEIARDVTAGLKHLRLHSLGFPPLRAASLTEVFQ